MGACGAKHLDPPTEDDEREANGGATKIGEGSEGMTSDSIVRNKLANKLKKKKNRMDVRGYSNVAQLAQNYEKKVIKKSDAVRKMIKSSLGAHFLFSNLSANTVEDVIDVMTEQSVKAGTVVIEQGDKNGDKFYVIEKGVFSIAVDGKEVAKYDGNSGKGPQQNFGELALLYNQPRSATVKAETDATLWCLDRMAFMKYMVGNADSHRDELARFLSKNALLGKLDDNAIDTLSEVFVSKQFNAGETIIKQGSQGSVFYLVFDGKVEVHKTGLDTKPVLTRGDFFGERALLNDEPRSASIVALTDCTCYALGKDDFKNLVSATSLRGEMEKTHQQRMAKETASSKTSDSDGSLSSKRKLMKCGLKDFQSVRVIGVGAFGMVRLVKHKKTGTPYALKMGAKKEMKLETKILSSLNQANCNELCATFDIGEKTYLVLEFLQGGDLITQICQHGTFSLAKTRYYAASVIFAFREIHSKNVVYRDLKLENLVLNSKGVLKVVDYGLAKIIKRRTYTVCGTPEYMAPEIIRAKGHSYPVDFWALGILIFEMLNGDTPFLDSSQDHIKIYKQILTYCKSRLADPEKKLLKFPEKASAEAQDLINGLLNPRAALRYGCKLNGIDDILGHPFFQGKNDFNWQSFKSGTLKPPFVPNVSNPFDTRNFEDFADPDQQEKGCTVM